MAAQNTKRSKEKKLIGLVEKIIEKNNGNRARHLVNIIVNHYMGDIRERLELKEYFNHKNPYIQGIATSVYAIITERRMGIADLSEAQKVEYGGFGATLIRTKRKLKFGKKQLWFSKNSGVALWGSENGGESLWYSVNSGRALSYATMKDNSLWFSYNSGESLRGAFLSDLSAWYSTNKEESLKRAFSCGYSLLRSSNYDMSLRESINRGCALAFSKNTGHSLFLSRNTGESLLESENSQNSLCCSINREKSLQGSKNKERALDKAKIYDYALHFSINCGMSLRNVELKGNAVFLPKFCERKDYALNIESGSLAEKIQKKSCFGEHEELSLEEIGRVLDLTRQGAYCILSSALNKIKRKLLKAGLDFQNGPSDFSEEKTSIYRCSLKDLVLPYYPRFRPYSCDERPEYPTAQSNLVAFFGSDFTSRIMWAVRNGVIDSQEE